MIRYPTRSTTPLVRSKFAAALWLTLTVMLLARPLMGSEADGIRPMRLSVTVVDPDQVNARGQKIDSVSWIREIFRQHLLMVAREEFGMVTRDELLGEPVDRNDPDCFHLTVLPWQGTEVELVLRRGEQTLLKTVVDNGDAGVLTQFRSLPHRVLEKQTVVVEALTKAGYTHTPLAKGDLQTLPVEIETLLKQMNHVSQYAAVRRLHRLMREHGESPAILGGLVRGYAHLTQLTLPVLDLRHRAFGARSLLYAFRFNRLNTESPVSFWYRAYSFLWLGYPNGAQRDLEKAAKRVTSADQEPPWLPLVRHSIEYQFVELERLAQDEEAEFRETAAVLWFLASQMTSSDTFVIETGQAGREIIPHCQRVIAGLFETAGVALNHQLSVIGPPAQLEVLRRHLPDVPDLPDSDIAGLESAANESSIEELLLGLNGPPESESVLTEVTEFLRAAGETDPYEPSAYVLASNLNAWNLQHLFQRAYFLRHFLGVDAGDFVAATATTIGEDPFLTLYAAMGIPRIASLQQVSDVTKHIQQHELNFCSVGYRFLNDLPGQAVIADGTIYDYLVRSWQDAGYFTAAYRRLIQSYFGQYRLNQVQWLNNVSDKAPMYYAEQLLLDWPNVAGDADDWAERFPEYPDLQWSLARAQKTFGDIDKAIQHYDNYLRMVDDVNGYIGLAEAWYIRDRDSDKWMDILDSGLDCEDYFLSHSLAATRGAATLMRDGRFEDALPWAEIAAHSYSHAGVRCLRDCLTGLGEFEQAEQLAKQMTERYQAADWYDWCVTTGQGDLNAAWMARQQLLMATHSAGDFDWELTHAMHELLTDSSQAAIQRLSRVSGTRPEGSSDAYILWIDVIVSLLADREGDDETRDRTLPAIRDNQMDHAEGRAMADLASLFLDASATGQLNLQSREDVAERHSTAFEGNWPGMVAFFTGYYAWTHGNRERAVEWLKIPAQAPDGRNRMLAWKWLRDAGVDPIHIDGRIFPDAFLREQLQLPENK